MVRPCDLELQQHVPDDGGRLGVEIRGGLIEQDDLRVVDQGPCERQPLLEPLGQRRCGVVASLPQSQAGQQHLGPVTPGGLAHPIQPTEEVQHPDRRQVPVQARPPLAAPPPACAPLGPAKDRSRPTPHTCAPPEDTPIRPASIRTVVVFPAPFGPRRPKISPSVISRLNPSTATAAPKRRVRPSVRIMRAPTPSESDIPGEPDHQSAIGGRAPIRHLDHPPLGPAHAAQVSANAGDRAAAYAQPRPDASRYSAGHDAGPTSSKSARPGRPWWITAVFWGRKTKSRTACRPGPVGAWAGSTSSCSSPWRAPRACAPRAPDPSPHPRPRRRTRGPRRCCRSAPRARARRCSVDPASGDPHRLLPTEINMLYRALGADGFRGGGCSTHHTVRCVLHHLRPYPGGRMVRLRHRVRSSGKPLPISWRTWPAAEMITGTVAFTAGAGASPGSPYSTSPATRPPWRGRHAGRDRRPGLDRLPAPATDEPGQDPRRRTRRTGQCLAVPRTVVLGRGGDLRFR